MEGITDGSTADKIPELNRQQAASLRQTEQNELVSEYEWLTVSLIYLFTCLLTKLKNELNN